MDILRRIGKIFAPKPEDAYEKIADDIVLASLWYRTTIEESDNQFSADAGAEVACFLLHMFDRFLLREFGAKVRDEAFDEVSAMVLSHYSRAVFTPGTSMDVIRAFTSSIVSILNDRQDVYSACPRLCSGKDDRSLILSREGTILLALSFYIHKAFRRTNRPALAEDLLRGKRSFAAEDWTDLPELPAIMKTEVTVMAILIDRQRMWNSCFRRGK